MVSHDKKLYNSLVQMAMLASLLRFQPDLGAVPPPPEDADLILGQSWAHTSARTVHAHLEHAAHHKNIDNVLEQYQQELFEELHSLGRYQRPFDTARHIHAYQLLDGDPQPPAPPAANITANSSASQEEDDLPLDLELGLERELDRRLEHALEAGLPLPPAAAEFNVWEMMDADLAAAGEEAESGHVSLLSPGPTAAAGDYIGSDAAVEDYIQSDVDMSDEDAEAVEQLLRQDMGLASAPRWGLASPADGSAASCCSPLTLDGEDEDDLVPLKPAQERVEDEWPLLETIEEHQLHRWRSQRTTEDWEDEDEEQQDQEDAAEQEEQEEEDALRHLWQRMDAEESPDDELVFRAADEDTEKEEDEEEDQEDGEDSPASPPSPSEERRDSDASDMPEKVRHVSGEDSGQGSSAESEEPGDAELALLDEMIDTVRRRPELVQGRLPFIRTMSMEQRWQDLASLLSLPAQEAAAAGAGMSHAAHQQMLAASQHHPAAAAYPYGAAPAGYHPHHHHPHHHHADMTRSVLLQNASLAAPPPPPPPAVSAADLVTNGSAGYSSGMGSVSHLGSAVVSSMNLTTDGLHPSSVATSAASGEMMYYQNSAAALAASVSGSSGASEPPPPPPHDGGFLSQILGVDELQLMEMPMSDGHAEWAAGAGGGDDQFSVPTSDYAKVSQAHRLPEYGGYRAAAAAASPTVPGPPPDSRAASLPSAQLKKHQFFGKRYFQGSDGPYGAAGGSALPAGSPSPVPPLKYPSAYGAEGGLGGAHGYPPPTPGAAEAAAALDSPELKYSCSMDFMRGHPGDRMGLVSHNHSYHLPPQTEGPSGVQRQLSRDKHGERPKEHLTRDEKRARSMSIPLSNEDIIHLPMDEFNERLSKHDLTEAQLSLIRDIRRRGKNKLAAQNCRKRKLDQILTLAEEVQRAKDQKQQTLADHQFLLQERGRIKEKYSQLYRHVFQSLRDPDGNPYSPLEYSLQQSADGSILLVPRNTTGGATVEPDPSTGARRKQRDPQKPE